MNLALQSVYQFGYEIAGLRSLGIVRLGQSKSSGGELLGPGGSPIRVEALLRVDYPAQKDVRFSAVVIQATADKFSTDRISRRHKIKKLRRSTICQPCIINRHLQCAGGDCCCICEEIYDEKK